MYAAICSLLLFAFIGMAEGSDVPVPPPTRLEIQNTLIEKEKISRIRDADEFSRMKRDGELVPILPTKHLKVDSRLLYEWRWCRPWTLRFLTDFSEAYYRVFRRKLQVNSAVRTPERQVFLQRNNANAAPADGPKASPHLTGAVVDITKKKMSARERKWCKEWLLKKESSGEAHTIEESLSQAVFHVWVSKTYGQTEKASK